MYNVDEKGESLNESTRHERNEKNMTYEVEHEAGAALTPNSRTGV